MKNKLFFLVILYYLFIALAIVFPQNSAFEKSEELFLQNKPLEAIPSLLAALNVSPNNENIYLMLGISYSQINELEKAVEYFKNGGAKALKDKDIFYYNAGNIYYLMEQYTQAENMYSLAVGYNSSKGGIFLNRANTRLNIGKKMEAVADYKAFLQIEPDNYQKDSILSIIALLEQKVGDEEVFQQQQEEVKKQQQQEEMFQKQQEEVRELAEQQRKKEMLQDVLNSLDNIGSETRKVSAGTEEISDYVEELELID